MITVGVKHEHEAAKRLIASGITDIELIICRAGIDRKTATDFLNQWRLWNGDDEDVSTLPVKH